MRFKKDMIPLIPFDIILYIRSFMESNTFFKELRHGESLSAYFRQGLSGPPFNPVSSVIHKIADNYRRDDLLAYARELGIVIRPRFKYRVVFYICIVFFSI